MAIILIVGCAVLFAWTLTSAGAKVPVVVVAEGHKVAAGQTITRQDLTTVDVAGSLTAIAGSNLDSIVGQKAAVPLLEGMPVQRSMVTDRPGLGADLSQVGVAVTSGQAPSDGLQPGETVQVLRLPDKNASSSSDQDASPDELVGRANVQDVRADPAQAGGTLLTLTVPAGSAPAVAMASSAGQVALVRVASQS